MSRYIDADKLKERLDLVSVDAITLYEMGINAGLHRAEAEVEMLPTANVVEVVRCKDCIYYDANCCFNPQWDMESSPEVPMVRETDYCSYGERRDQNEG